MSQTAAGDGYKNVGYSHVGDQVVVYYFYVILSAKLKRILQSHFGHALIHFSYIHT